MTHKGTYPRADTHIQQSGLRTSELAKSANISEKSIMRVRRGAPVLNTTVQRVINALNSLYFNNPANAKAPLEFDKEFVLSVEEKL